MLLSITNVLYFYITNSHSISPVLNMAVFCTSFVSCLSGMLLRHFVNDFEVVPVAPVVAAVNFVFTFYMNCISFVRSLYLKIFSDYYYYYFY